MHTFTPNTKTESAKVNENFSNLAQGLDFEDNGSLLIYRAESARNFVASGLNWSVVSGRDGSLSSGVAYIKDSNGLMQRVVVPLTTKTFTASKDTYVELAADGTITYNEQTTGVVPSYTANTIPLALVGTDATTITKLILLAPRNPDEVARATVVVETDTIIIPNIEAYRYLYVDVALIDNNAAISFTATLNNDTTSSYLTRTSTNGGADSAPAAAASIVFGTGNAPDPIYASLTITNLATEEKEVSGLVYRANAVGVSPSKIEVTSKWDDTSVQASRMDIINTGAGSYGVNSQIIIKGRN